MVSIFAPSCSTVRYRPFSGQPPNYGDPKRSGQKRVAIAIGLPELWLLRFTFQTENHAVPCLVASTLKVGRVYRRSIVIADNRKMSDFCGTAQQLNMQNARVGSNRRICGIHYLKINVLPQTTEGSPHLTPGTEDFFISYTGVDRAWAEWIAWQLKQAGYSVVLQAWHFRPGSNWPLNMKKATSTTKRTIAVLSPEYLKSPNAQSEWAAAFAEDPDGSRGKILPILVRPTALQGLDLTIVYVDLTGKDEQQARQELARSLRGPEVSLEPDAPPVFPGQPSANPNVATVQPAGPIFPPDQSVDPKTANKPTLSVWFEPPDVLTGNLPVQMSVHFEIISCTAELLLSFEQNTFGIDKPPSIKGVDIVECETDHQFRLTFAALGSYDLPFGIRALKAENGNDRIRMRVIEDGKELYSEKRWINISARGPWLDRAKRFRTWLKRHRRAAPLVAILMLMVLAVSKLPTAYPDTWNDLLESVGLIQPDYFDTQAPWKDSFKTPSLKTWHTVSPAQIIGATAELIQRRRLFFSLFGQQPPMNFGTQRGGLAIHQNGFARPVFWVDPRSHPRFAREPILRRFETLFTGFLKSGSFVEWMFFASPNRFDSLHWHGFHVLFKSSVSDDSNHPTKLSLIGEICEDVQKHDCTIVDSYDDLPAICGDIIFFTIMARASLDHRTHQTTLEIRPTLTWTGPKCGANETRIHTDAYKFKQHAYNGGWVAFVGTYPETEFSIEEINIQHDGIFPPQ